MDPPPAGSTVESNETVKDVIIFETESELRPVEVEQQPSQEAPTVSTTTLAPVATPQKVTSPLQNSTSTLNTTPATAPSTKSHSMSTLATTSAAKTTFLTRKAHKFSALKKKKGASQLLNKLFCNIPLAAAKEPPMKSLADQTSPGTTVENSPTAAGGTGSSLSSFDLLTVSKSTSGSENQASCVTFSQALEQASDALAMTAEEEVRSSIQASLTQVYSAVAKEVQTFSGTPTRAAQQKPMKTPGGGGCGDVGIPTPAVHKKSLFPTTMKGGSLWDSSDIDMSVDTDAAAAMEEKCVDNATTNSFFKFILNPLAGPAHPLVEQIPSNDPTSSRYRGTHANVEMDGPAKSGDPPAGKDAHKSKAPAVGTTDTAPVDDNDDEDAAFLPDDFNAGQSDSQPKISNNSSSTAAATSTPAAVPKSPARPAPPRSTSPVPNSPARREMGRRYTWAEMERRISEAVNHAKEEWKIIMGEEVRAAVVEEQEHKYEIALRETKSQAEDLLQEHGEQWRKDHQTELDQIKAKYERKVNEMKDQTAMANRLAKTHETEIQSLETQLITLRAAPTSGPKIAVLQAELIKVKKEKETFLETVKKELTTVKAKLATTVKESAETKAKLVKAETEVADVQAKLSSSEKQAVELQGKLTAKEGVDALASLKDETVDVISTPEPTYKPPSKGFSDSKSKETPDIKTKLASKEREAMDLKSNLAIKEKEVTQLHSQLSNKEKETAEFKTKLSNKEKEASESKSKVAGLEKEIGTLNAKLNAAEMEADSVKDMLSAKEDELKSATINASTSTTNRRLSTGSPARRMSSSPARSVSRLSKPNTTPTRSPAPKTPGRNNGTPKIGGSNSKSRRDSEPLENTLELHEREKESLRSQIYTLEEQLTKSNQVHECSLNQLRLASETELIQVKKDMENRLEHHMIKERELKDTLFNVDSRDKEELLEMIEHLEAEKKADRNGGLREVQKKEDLLQRISALEKVEKELVTSHDLALQDVRNKSEGEIRKLKNELEKQRDERIAKERELHLAISETSSFEKEELLEKIDKLESKLAGERSGAVLIKMKISNLEKELKAEEKKHNEEIQELRSTTDAEVKRLEKELEVLTALQAETKVVTIERDSLLEQVQELRIEIEQERSDYDLELGKLRKQHTEEVESIKKNAATDLETVQKEAKQKAAEAVQEFEIVSKRSSGDQSEWRTKVEELEAKAKTSQDDYEHKLLQVSKDHTMQLDELLQQLDLVEAEHKEKMTQKEGSTFEKDAIIKALGMQLAEAENRTIEIDAAHKKLTEEASLAREEATTAAQEVETMKAALDKAKASHENFMAGEVERQERACEEAREEMIERAEVQFKSANDLYVKLKKEYDASIAKVDRLESELKEAKRSIEAAKNEQEDCVADLKADVAQLKALNAKTESDSAQRAKEYRREMESLLKAAKDFENKLEDAEATSHSLEQSLSALVSGKAKLQNEYDEMKNVCEELMLMVEGQEGQKHEF